MEEIAITSVSSRGQIVIPLSLRSKMKIREGEKFVVIGEDDTLVLKKMQVPSFSGIDKLLRKTKEFAKNKNLTSSDVSEAVKNSRRK